MSKALDRLSKILEKAEHTDNDNERDTFMHAAEEMAATLGVDLAVARAHAADKTRREEPVKRTIKVGNIGSKGNAHLIDLFLDIAAPHDVQCTISRSNLYVFAFGLPSDIDIVEALYGITVTAMISDANAALKRGDHKTVPPAMVQFEFRWQEIETEDGCYDDVKVGGKRTRHIDGRIWRANFYIGYRTELRSRLWAARKRATTTPEAESTGVALVLADKVKEVKDFFEHEHRGVRLGTYGGASSTEYVGDALAKGRDSAARTNLSTDAKVGGSKARALE